MARRVDADVVIAGAGAVGCCYAERLARAGLKVTVLEAGAAWTLADLESSQIRARRLKWSGAPVFTEGANPFGNNMGTGSGFGGAALHHYAGWPRLHPADLATRTRFGRGEDWPFDYDELRPFYDRVQAYAGIAGDAEAEVWRPAGAPYPMRPHEIFAQGRMIASGFEKLGMRTAPAPLAITSEPFNGRPACLYDGWCDAGCPIGAIANPLVLHKAAAERAGATFLPNSTVTRILPGTKGRIAGFAHVDAAGAAREIHAKVGILACNPIQNARLLLASANHWAPEGLGNSSGRVGTGFFCHGIINVYGIFPDDTENHRGVTAGQLISMEQYAKEQPGKPFGSLQWGIGPALKPNDLLGIANTRVDLFGERLVKFLEQDSKRLGAMVGICESLPQPENRIELVERSDRFGVPLVRIVHGFDDEALALQKYGIRLGLEVFEAAGATMAWQGVTGTAHPTGGTIMGDDPGTSVADAFGCCHDVPNLWLGGAGLMPTAGAGSPTFTLYAMTERSADRLVEGFKEFAS